jgi:hypothetical protein
MLEIHRAGRTVEFGSNVPFIGMRQCVTRREEFKRRVVQSAAKHRSIPNTKWFRNCSMNRSNITEFYVKADYQAVMVDLHGSSSVSEERTAENITFEIGY